MQRMWGKDQFAIGYISNAHWYQRIEEGSDPCITPLVEPFLKCPGAREMLGMQRLSLQRSGGLPQQFHRLFPAEGLTPSEAIEAHALAHIQQTDRPTPGMVRTEVIVQLQDPPLATSFLCFLPAGIAQRDRFYGRGIISIDAEAIEGLRIVRRGTHQQCRSNR